MLIGFVPWIVYWMLVGNVPCSVSAVVGLVVALAAFALGRAAPGSKAESTEVIEIGAVATFFVVAVLTFAIDPDVVQRWLLPLTDGGLLATALVSVLIGQPFVRPYVAAGLPADVVKTELFGRIVGLLSWIWVGALAAMTVSAAIPSVIDPDSTLFDAKSPLSYICYWVVPTVLLAMAALVSKVLPDRMTVGIDDVARKTTFVAFAEAEIDQLIYLAQEHANREVGPGKEAYNVRIGGKGTPLVGDDTRQSWPSTYKVRDKRR
jgi:hypothetical protein